MVVSLYFRETKGVLKRFVFLMLVPFALCRGYSQFPDSLAKYSYLLTSKHTGGCFVASGFFINLNKKAYLITAKHNVSDWNSVEKRQMPTDNNFHIRLTKKSTNTDTLVFVDFSKAKKDTSRKSYFEEPDIYVTEFRNANLYDINYVNRFIKNYDGKIPQPGAVICYGFGGNEDYKTCETIMGKKTETWFGYLFHDINNRNVFPHQTGYDKINFAVDSLFGTTTSTSGFSGAPVFFIYKDSSVLFGGVDFAGAGRSAFVARPEFITIEGKSLMLFYK